jgi:hypothetical protein
MRTFLIPKVFLRQIVFIQPLPYLRIYKTAFRVTRNSLAFKILGAAMLLCKHSVVFPHHSMSVSYLFSWVRQSWKPSGYLFVRDSKWIPLEWEAAVLLLPQERRNRTNYKVVYCYITDYQRPIYRVDSYWGSHMSQIRIFASCFVSFIFTDMLPRVSPNLFSLTVIDTGHRDWEVFCCYHLQFNERNT